MDATPARKYPQDVLEPKILPQAGVNHLQALILPSQTTWLGLLLSMHPSQRSLEHFSGKPDKQQNCRTEKHCRHEGLGDKQCGQYASQPQSAGLHEAHSEGRSGAQTCTATAMSGQQALQMWASLPQVRTSS